MNLYAADGNSKPWFRALLLFLLFPSLGILGLMLLFSSGIVLLRVWQDCVSASGTCIGDIIVSGIVLLPTLGIWMLGVCIYRGPGHVAQSRTLFPFMMVVGGVSELVIVWFLWNYSELRHGQKNVFEYLLFSIPAVLYPVLLYSVVLMRKALREKTLFSSTPEKGAES